MSSANDVVTKKQENGDLESENDWKDPNEDQCSAAGRDNEDNVGDQCDDIAGKIPSYCWTAASLYMSDSMETPVS